MWAKLMEIWIFYLCLYLKKQVKYSFLHQFCLDSHETSTIRFRILYPLKRHCNYIVPNQKYTISLHRLLSCVLCNENSTLKPKKTHICHVQQWPTNTKYTVCQLYLICKGGWTVYISCTVTHICTLAIHHIH
jgi:hypothetical protein